jgi:hypothetical protein
MKMANILRAACVAAGLLLVPSAWANSAAPAPDSFLDQMQGRWKVTGTYNGHSAKHNFKGEWEFRNGYLRFRDVSEEEKADGLEEFEVIAYIGYDPANARYVCVWVDNSGTAAPESVAAATARVGDSLPFVFKSKDGAFHSTFIYNSKGNTWTWNMDSEKNGAFQPIARLTLRRER